MRPKTPVELIREAATRREAVYGYAAMHDHMSELEQLLVDEGRAVEAEPIHQYAVIALRAYRSELDDREPPDRPMAQCSKPQCPVCG